VLRVLGCCIWSDARDKIGAQDKIGTGDKIGARDLIIARDKIGACDKIGAGDTIASGERERRRLAQGFRRIQNRMKDSFSEPVGILERVGAI